MNFYDSVEKLLLLLSMLYFSGLSLQELSSFLNQTLGFSLAAGWTD